jgi:hypothetical protein
LSIGLLRRSRLAVQEVPELTDLGLLRTHAWVVHIIRNELVLFLLLLLLCLSWALWGLFLFF